MTQSLVLRDYVQNLCNFYLKITLREAKWTAHCIAVITWQGQGLILLILEHNDYSWEHNSQAYTVWGVAQHHIAATECRFFATLRTYWSNLTVTSTLLLPIIANTASPKCTSEHCFSFILPTFPFSLARTS